MQSPIPNRVARGARSSSMSTSRSASLAQGIALALSLPDNEWKPMILTVTYVIVIFSIVVQGLTITRVANRVGREPDLV